MSFGFRTRVPILQSKYIAITSHADLSGWLEVAVDVVLGFPPPPPGRGSLSVTHQLVVRLGAGGVTRQRIAEVKTLENADFGIVAENSWHAVSELSVVECLPGRRQDLGFTGDLLIEEAIILESLRSDETVSALNNVAVTFQAQFGRTCHRCP